jgi:hypothetical protein
MTTVVIQAQSFLVQQLFILGLLCLESGRGKVQVGWGVGKIRDRAGQGQYTRILSQTNGGKQQSDIVRFPALSLDTRS